MTIRLRPSLAARLLPGLAAAVLTALAVLPTRAQTVTVYALADSVRVGEAFDLVVRAEGPDLETLLPDTGRAFAGPDVEVLARLRTGTAPGGAAGGRVDSAVYRVAAFALDTLVVPPVAVGFVQGTDTLLVPSRPFALPMIATAPPDAEGLRPPLDRMGVGWPWWFWALAALALIAVAALVAWALRRAKAVPPTPRTPPPTPGARALQRLTTLDGADLADPAQVKPFYVELTEALRQYLEAVTPIPALELTSSDVLRRARQLARDGALPENTVQHLADIFAVADYAKFADGLPPADAGARTRSLACDVVNRIEMHRAMHATPPPAEQP